MSNSSITTEQPLPETLPQIPAPETVPGPNIVEPAPDSPLRTSPRPGTRPRPSTDPKQFPHKLMPSYFGPVPGRLKKLAERSVPFGKNGVPRKIISRVEAEECEARNAFERSRASLWMLFDIPKLQAGHQQDLWQFVVDYLAELLGKDCGRVVARLNVEFEENDPAAVQEILDKLEGKVQPEDKEAGFDGTSREYLCEAVRRAEMYSLLAQGFALIHMKKFLEWGKPRFESLSPGLFEAYKTFFEVSRVNHFALFRKQIAQGGECPLGPEHSLGESDVCYEPETDPDDPDRITGINAYGRATSANGIILAHEALKASFQLLTVWAKRYDNYCTKEEWLALRMLVNSPFAEMRQFALGPSVFEFAAEGLASAGVRVAPGNPDFYSAIQEWIGGTPEFFREMNRKLGIEKE